MNHLRNLQLLEKLNIYTLQVNTSDLHSFVSARGAILKKFLHRSSYSKFAMDFLADSSKSVLVWQPCSTRTEITDEEIFCLLDLMGNELCLRIVEIDLKGNSDSLTSVGLNFIAEKCLNVKKIDVRGCKKIIPAELKKFKLKLPKCAVLGDETEKSCAVQ